MVEDHLRRVLRAPGVIQGATPSASAGLRAAMAVQDPEVARLRQIARRALAGEPDSSRGAQFFHAAHARPAWARRMTLVASIGRLRFYRERVG